MIPSIALIAAAQAASVTVNPGDDLSTLTSSLSAGDVVTFTAGTYELDGQLNWSGLGSEVAPITFTANTGAQVILRNSGGGYVVNVTDAGWVEIRGLIFEAAGDLEYNQPSGLRIGSSSNVTVEDCVVRNVYGTGVRVDGDSSAITVQRTEIGPSESGSGIYVGVGNGSTAVVDSLFAYNFVHDVADTGIVFLDGTQNVTAEHNVVTATGDDGVFLPNTLQGPQNILRANAIWNVADDGVVVVGPALVQNNVVFDTGDEGIVTVNSDGSLYDVQISHNTVANNGGFAAQLNGWYNAPEMVFANNALANPTGRSLEYVDPLSNQDPKDPKPSGNTDNFIANNVVTGLINGFDPAVRPEWIIPGGGVGDFVDIDSFDFYPTAGSQVINAATPNGNAFIPMEDFNGALRNGANPEAGAYEYDAPGNPGWPIQEDFKVVGDLGSRGGATLARGCCNDSSNDAGTQALLLAPWVLFGALLRRRRRSPQRTP